MGFGQNCEIQSRNASGRPVIQPVGVPAEGTEGNL